MQNTNSKINTILLIIVIILLAIGAYFLMAKRAVTPGDDSDVTPPAQITFAPLTTKYITAQTWPPTVTTLTQSYSCTPTSETSVGVIAMSERVIDGREYCVEVRREGAAGSAYDTFTYTTDSTQIMFILKLVQCTNYNDPQKTECLTERAAFDPDQIIIDANI